MTVIKPRLFPGILLAACPTHTSALCPSYCICSSQECANIRFCSEVIWMLFWVLNHSYVMKDLWDRGSPNRNPGARDRLAQLRNSFQHLVRDLQAQLGIRPAVSNVVGYRAKACHSGVT